MAKTTLNHSKMQVTWQSMSWSAFANTTIGEQQEEKMGIISTKKTLILK